MNKAGAAKISLFYAVFLAALIFLIVIFSNSIWITGVFGLALTAVIASIVLGHVKTARINTILGDLYSREKDRDLSLASDLLSDIMKDSTGLRAFPRSAAECITEKFRLDKIAILFKQKSGFEVKIYLNINPRDIYKPRTEKIRGFIKDIPPEGRFSGDHSICETFIKEKAIEEFKTLSLFAYNYGKSRTAIVIYDDSEGNFTNALSDPGFNSAFWPSLDDALSVNDRAKRKELELRNVKNDFSKVKRDLAEAGKEINRRTAELSSFVDISAGLYSILEEDQLFSSLKNIIMNQIGASKVEILYPTGEGKFIATREPNGSQEKQDQLALSIESELFEMLINKPKPLLLPLVAGVSKSDNGFLKSAVGSGFQVISPLSSGNEIGCLLLIGGKKANSRYSESEINFVSIITNIASLSLANIRQFATIEKLSYTDSMTGIFNYRYFYKRLGEEILRAKRFNRELSLVIMDIDNFKNFNDSYGHQTGDMVLKSTADLITRAIRSIDIVSRYGGEEFCIIMPDTGEESGRVFIERLRKEIAEFAFKSHSVSDELSITVSVGCSVFPRHAETPDRLIYCADMALLKAKASGRNRAIMFQTDLAESEFSLREDEL